MAENEIFWGLNIAGWTALTAIGTFGIALATILVAVVAGYQISEARRETRTNRTMEIIGRYDHDAVLEQALRHLAEGRDKGDLASNVMAYRLDIVSILNYLESIAIGTKQGLYIRELIEDYMEPIIRYHVEETLSLNLLKELKAEEDDFEHVFMLKKEWDDARKAGKLKYKGRS